MHKLDLYLAVSTFISSGLGSRVLTTNSGKKTTYKCSIRQNYAHDIQKNITIMSLRADATNAINNLC